MKIEKGKRKEEKGKLPTGIQCPSQTPPAATRWLLACGPCGIMALSSCQKGQNSTKLTIFDELVCCNSHLDTCGRIYYLTLLTILRWPECNSSLEIYSW
jgi:hypothetical protein